MKTLIMVSFFMVLMFTAVMAQKGVFATRKSLVILKSDAPLELIKASSAQLKGVLDTEKRTFAFTIPSKSFEGFNSPLQQVHFYENYIEATRYPEASFTGKIIEQINFNADGEFQVRAKGNLSIHGVEQERIIRIGFRINKGILYATADFTIMLQEYNITIPKVVYQKIAEEIFIHVIMELERI